MARSRDYYTLTKPGIIYGNVLHAAAGSLFAIAASGGGWQTLFISSIGIGLVIASACVVNNLTDTALDVHMERTRKRPSVTGVISRTDASIFAVVLGLLGFGALALTSWLVVMLGVVSYIWYTVFYAYAKRWSPLGTLVGTVPGALPIVAGYVAVSTAIDSTAVGLGFLLVAWQMVHFYAIAIFRKDEYARAGVPVITSRLSERDVRSRMIIWASLYVCITLALIVLKSIGMLPGLLLFVAASYWLFVTIMPMEAPKPWARKVFGVSLMLSLCLFLIGAVAIVVA